jgi:MFS family permease
MKKKSGFYGWKTLAGAILVTVIGGGAFIGTFGVYLPVISDKFGWSRASISLALSLGILAFGLPGPFFGYCVNKLGPRVSIILGNSLAVIATAFIFLANKTWHYYLLYIIIGLGNGLGGYIACTTLVNNWFVKKRTLALGIFTSSAGFSGFIYPPIVTALIGGLGFRESWLALAGLVMVGVVILGGVVLIRNRPEDFGQAPDGNYANSNATTENAVQAPGNALSEWRTMQIFKINTTWLIAGFIFADALAMGTVITHQIAYIQDIGFSPMVAASTASFQSLFTIAGSLAFGALSLKLNIKYVTGTAFLLQVISLIILLTSKNLAIIYIYAVFMGLSIGAIFTAMATFVGVYYPREHFAQVIGVILAFYVVAQSIAALAVGAIFDATHQYTLAFGILGVFSAAGLILALLVRPPNQSIFNNQHITKN